MSVFLKRHGLYLGVDPAFPAFVYGDRQHGAAWEEVLVTAHAGGLIDVLFVAANRQLTITPDGQLETRIAGTFQEWEQMTVLPLPASGLPLLRRVNVSPSQPIEVEGYTAEPPAAAIHLEQRGQDFVDASGQRTVLCGCDMFLAYRQFLDGGAAALVPFVEESREIGFTVWRIFMQGSKAQNQVMDLSPREPRYYDQLRPFVDTLNANGIIPLATVFVDNQDVQAGINHWSQLADRLRGTATLLSGGNQFSKNGFDPFALPDPGGFIWSRGSDVEDTITLPRGASASELHATRISFDRALMDATASPPYMRSKGAGLVWMTEGNPFDDGSDPVEAWSLGRAYSIQWGLAVMHNRQSQRGLLMKPGTRRCADAWVKGMRIA